MNAAVATPADAAYACALDCANAAEDALDRVTAPLEFAALAGLGIDPDGVQRMWAAHQAHQSSSTAKPAGAHTDMRLRIAALANKLEAARRAEFEPCGLAALAFCAFTDAVELAAKEGRGISAEDTQGLEELHQAYVRAREPMLLAFSDTGRATEVLLHALRADWSNG